MKIDPEIITQKIQALGLYVNCTDDFIEQKDWNPDVREEDIPDFERYRFWISTAPRTFPILITAEPGKTNDSQKDSQLQTREDGKWELRRWHYVPGPGPGDFVFVTDSFERILESLRDLYFGSPTVVDGWEFPLYKHPDWDREKFHSSLANRKSVSFSEWTRIYLEHRREHAANVERKDHWYYQRENSFHRIESAAPSEHFCRLRADMGEVYVIQTPLAPELNNLFAQEYKSNKVAAQDLMFEVQDILQSKPERYFHDIQREIEQSSSRLVQYRWIQGLKDDGTEEILDYIRSMLENSDAFIRVALISSLHSMNKSTDVMETVIRNHLEQHPADDPDTAKGRKLLRVRGLFKYE